MQFAINGVGSKMSFKAQVDTGVLLSTGSSSKHEEIRDSLNL